MGEKFGTSGPRALITGITSQDGAYLASLLLDKGYRVTGTLRPGGTMLNRAWRLETMGLAGRVTTVTVDLTDARAVSWLLDDHAPDEVYHLSAHSSVHSSFHIPAETFASNAVATTNLLEVIRTRHPRTRFYHASTSEMFGEAPEVPQTEKTLFRPRSPYAVAKVAAHQMTTLYRIAYGLFCVNGILFNHESPLRGPEFVTAKIVRGLVRWQAGLEDAPMALGRLDARRDWGFAGDYVRGMWSMLQAEGPDDYVLASGRTWSVRDFVSLTANALDMRLLWQGEGVGEVAIELDSGRTCVTVDPALFRPAEVGELRGDSSRARERLDWTPRVDLPELVAMMVAAEKVRQGLA
ncbi:GDP-mannose 4,6-dehydratase [Niveispirillum sp. KHB5.9]|uniref:GDP-mannose 4,6-dehydratase n=1 Tax=Niveispirillum sp. KHB5.9 TaxID=3400269 RepID=UPI003A8AD941